jgi:hypothetical protein
VGCVGGKQDVHQRVFGATCWGALYAVSYESAQLLCHEVTVMVFLKSHRLGGS